MRRIYFPMQKGLALYDFSIVKATAPYSYDILRSDFGSGTAAIL
jgi:hypothetical protein